MPPIATITAYGPNDTLATKLVVSILGSRDQLIEMRKWITVAVDVRRDPTIAAAVVEFLAEHGVKKSIHASRIFGCPHEEGIDYPMGRSCLRCPFWATRDRFSGELIRPPVAKMTLAEVVDVLASPQNRPPKRALESADAHRDELAKLLLKVLADTVADPDGTDGDDAHLFPYALYLLAKWRDIRAYPLVCRWLSLPEEGPFDIGGDIVTEHGAVMLASVFDGDLEPIKALILER